MPNFAGLKRLKKLRAELDEKTVMSDGRRAKMYIGNLGDAAIPVCIVQRNSDQIYRGGQSTLTNASTKGVLCWMMDTTLISMLADTYFITYLITLERETGDLWVSKLADWSDLTKTFNPTEAGLLTRTYRGAALTYLPTRQMIHLAGDRQLITRSR